MAVVGAGVRKLTSRSHLEAESIGGTCTSQEGDERRRRDPFPSLDTTRTHNTLLPASPGGPRPQGRAGPGPTVGANPVGQWDDRSSRLLVASPAFRSCTRLTEFNHLHSIRNRNVPASVIIKIDIYFSSMETRGWRRKQFGVGGWSRTSRKSLGPSKRRSFPRSARAPRALSFLMYETRRVGPFLSGGTIGSSVRGK